MALGEVTQTTAVQIVAKAFELAEIDNYAEYFDPQNPQQLRDTQRPVPPILKVDTPHGPCLYLLFRVGERLIADAHFNPIAAAEEFMKIAREMVMSWAQYYDFSRQEIEEAVFTQASDMLCNMLLVIHPRIELTSGYLIHEIYDLQSSATKDMEEKYAASQGKPLQFRSGSEFREAVYRKQTSAIKQLYSKTWGGSMSTVEATDKQKIEFARHYQTLHQYWANVLRLYIADPEGDWQDKAKKEEPDTPDDLLERLANPDADFEQQELSQEEVDKLIDGQSSYPNAVFALALEHSARRAKIQKLKGCDPATLLTRRRGIPVTGHKPSALYKLLREGKALLEEQKSE
jgi:hypothetical protein